ncbi:MAG: DNA polymerase III subunit delta [Patescibacteria group bacterium]
MILFFYGDNSYSAWDKINQIKHRFISTHPEGQILEWSPDSLLPISKLFETQSLFSSKQLVVMRNVFSETDAEQREEILELVSSPPPEHVTVIIWESDKVDRRQKLFKLLNQPKLSQEFKVPASHQLPAFINQIASPLGLSLTPQLTGQLIESCGTNLWKLRNEIIKLSACPDPTLYTSLISPSEELAAFAFQNSITDQNQRASISIITKELTNSADSSYMLVGGIAVTLRNLLLIGMNKSLSPSQLASQTKLHPFVVSKLIPLTNARPLSFWRELLLDVSELDYKMKTGKLDSTAGLTALVAKMTT